MDVVAYDDYEQLLRGPAGPYYEGRWEYIRKVAEIVQRQSVSSVLEIGPSFTTIVKGCDIMLKDEDDPWGRPIETAPMEYRHDATKVPWPIGDKQYGMFIGLQVWEHLEGRQREAFAEVIRISEMAVLSFPYLWDCPTDNPHYPSHHMIDEKVIAEWTLGIEPVEIIRIPKAGDRISKGPRIIYFWKFS